MLLRRATCLSLLISIALAATAHAGTVGREQDIVDLKLGQRVQVDDGTCPAGQVPLVGLTFPVSGAKVKAPLMSVKFARLKRLYISQRN